MEEGPPYDREAPIWEHLEELGRRLRGFVIAFIVVFALTWLPVPRVNVHSSPLEMIGEFFASMFASYTPIVSEFLRLAILAKVPERVGGMEVDVTIIMGNINAALSALFFASILLSLLATAPYLIYEIYQYVKPALYPHELESVRKYLWSSVLLFYLGVAFGIEVVVPIMYNFFLMFAGLAQVRPIVTLDSVVNMAVVTAMVSGALFLTPTVVAILTEVELLTPQALVEHRLPVYAVAMVLIAWLTPDPTLASDVALLVPFVILFESSIWISKRIYARKIKYRLSLS